MRESITLVKDNKILSKNLEVAETVNDFLSKKIPIFMPGTSDSSVSSRESSFKN